jgi:hypothetical protein
MEHPRRGQARLPENAAYLRVAACLEASINPQGATSAMIDWQKAMNA